nr:amino acid permease [Candidatus Mycoplasma haemohominis]
MIGAGIFIKTQTLNSLAHNRVGPIVFLFLVFLVNMFAFCRVLVKIIPSQKGNMGFMGWSHKLCSPRLHICCCNFMRYFYHPISLLLFSVYAIVGMTEGMLGVFSTMFLSCFLAFVFMLINFLSFKWAHRLQIILSCLVVIPLLLLPIVALAAPRNISDMEATVVPKTASGLASLGPWMLLFSGLPSLLFIYDGFYGVAALKDRLKKPGSLSFVILASIVIVTIIYLNIIVSFNIGDSLEADYRNFRFFSGRPVLKDLFSILISCASLLTLNSIAMSSLPQLTAMHDTHRFSDIVKIKKSIFYKNIAEEENFEERFTIWIYLLFKTLIWFLLVGFIVFFMQQYGLSNSPMEIIDSLADIVTVFVFLILLFVILGSFKKKNIRKSVGFKVCALFSGGTIVLALFYLIISYIVGTTGFGDSNVFNSWVKLILIIGFIIGCCYWQIKDFLDGRLNKKSLTLYPKHRKGSIIILK